MTAIRKSWRSWRVMVTMSFRAAPGLASTVLLIAIGAGVIGGLTPYALKLFVNGVVSGDRDTLVVASVLLSLGVVVSWAALSLLAATFGQELGGRVTLLVQTEIARLAGGCPAIEHFERPEYLRELDLLTQNQGAIGDGPRTLALALTLVIRVVLNLVLLVAVDPLLGLLIPFSALPFVFTRQATKVRERADEALAEDRRLLGHVFRLASTPGSGRELRVYGFGSTLASRHAELDQQIVEHMAAKHLVAGLLVTSGWLLYAASFVAAIVYVVLEAADGLLTLGAVVLTVQIGRSATQQISGVADVFANLMRITVTTRRYLWLEDYAAEASAPPGAASSVPQRLHQGISFEDVSFRYPGTTNDVLSHVNVHLPAGSTVALVGENGAGKTTLVKLLSRMYEPTGGRILVDGVDLASLPIEEWRARLSSAFQDFARYELVAGEVVGVGDLPRMDDRDAIDTAMDRADAAALIPSFDEAHDTPLGRTINGGRELSGGQWQKLAIGRGMMRDEPLVLLLDEPTASLDAATEHALFERYASAARRTGTVNGAITLLVSHRFSTVQMADLIVVLDDTEVTEVGSHAELLAANGTYAELYDLQARAYR